MVNVYFIDSSALVKRYITEASTPWIQAITAPRARNKLIIARITWVEVLSALARRQREGNLASVDVVRSIQVFRYDLDTQYQVVELDQALAEMAGQLTSKYPLRAYDAVQLASALRIQSAFAPIESSPLVFLSADDRLIDVAQAAGLRVDSPLLHL
ncbi:MAG: type II toxin-antitoxin system VapC family toxin [Chloroflexi bacterium]|nr:type II toxin-antitoxin system VapC family toxin [Chloroflexota bacterium]MBU1748848.1 type II toxin-antitoxin system VapC family toxin [Chloroflexota bacterium]